jgi:hypothetical protein
MISRRDLLKILLATPAAALIDYENLLWTPKPIIVVPSIPTGQIVAEMWCKVAVPLPHLFDRDDIFYRTFDKEVDRIANALLIPMKDKK